MGYAGGSVPLPEAYAYTDGASTGTRGPGGYGVVIRWEGKTKEISGGETNTTNLRMELTAACVALETIEEGSTVSVYSDASYLINCMRRGWYKKWRENGWLNYRNQAVANKDLWERLLRSGAAPPAGALEKGQGAPTDPRPTQVRQRPGRRTRCSRQERGNQTIDTVVTMTKWLLQASSGVGGERFHPGVTLSDAMRRCPRSRSSWH